MAEVNYKELKKGGFMRQIQKETFSLRLRVVGGQIQADHLKKIGEIAEKFGEGYVHLTSRQSVEIPFVRLAAIDEVKNELAAGGLQIGVCGPRVRTITACQGSKICPQGLIDTTELAREIDKRYYAIELPHKFKFGITGCRNNCLKAEENDFGIKGGIKPEWNESACTFCGLCEAICPTAAIKVNKQEKNLNLDERACIYCGKCVKSCPTEAWNGKNGFIVYFGGLFGNRIAIGKQLLPLIYTEADLHKAIEATLDFFQKNAKQGERFRTTLDRIGWASFQSHLETAL
jgi:anaerobic sulfite reductase subunit C